MASRIALLSASSWTQRFPSSAEAAAANRLTATETPRSDRHHTRPPVVSGGVVWIMSREGYLYALDPVTGHLRYASWPCATITHFPTLSAGAGQLFITLGKQVANYAFTSTTAKQVGGHNFTIGLDASGNRSSAGRAGPPRRAIGLTCSAGRP